MEFIRRLLESEPTVVIGLVGAVLALAVTFGVQISDAQMNAIKDVVTNLMIFAGVLLGIRQSVYAPDTAARIAAEIEANAAGGNDAAA